MSEPFARGFYESKPEWWDDPTEPRCDVCGMHMLESDGTNWDGDNGTCYRHSPRGVQEDSWTESMRRLRRQVGNLSDDEISRLIQFCENELDAREATLDYAGDQQAEYDDFWR